MAHKPRQSGIVEQGEALTALISTVRQEIIDTIEAIGGEVAIADIAAQLGRPADGIYYHVRRLVDSGLLREGSDPGDGRGRRYRTMARRGQRIRLKYGRGTRANDAAVLRVVHGLLRTAERDFARALLSGRAKGEGAQRDLWASRLKGWVDADDLAEVNRLLVRLSELLLQPRTPDRDHLISLAWMLSPIDGKPLRRDGLPPAPARRLR